MIDIHAHIIPFVDDGSQSLSESVRLVREEIAQGVKEIICTPHYDLKRYTPSLDLIKENFALLKNAVESEKLDVKLSLGQEICYYKTLDIIKMLKNNELLTLKDTNYVLLEFDFFNQPDSLTDIIYNIRINGFKPIIAHVERYEWLNLYILEKMIEEGAFIQVNANSILDKKNKLLYKRTKSYLKNRMVNFIASDVHEFRNNNYGIAMKKYGKYLNYFEL